MQLTNAEICRYPNVRRCYHQVIERTMKALLMKTICFRRGYAALRRICMRCNNIVKKPLWQNADRKNNQQQKGNKLLYLRLKSQGETFKIVSAAKVARMVQWFLKKIKPASSKHSCNERN